MCTRCPLPLISNIGRHEAASLLHGDSYSIWRYRHACSHASLTLVSDRGLTMLSSKARRIIGAAVAAGVICVGAFALFGSPVSASPGDHGNSPAHQIYTSPQPTSNADYSGHGANVHGPYDSTRDGSASQNGKGDGKAAGKPCAGCVGKADNKNPAGQMPGGSDNNAGYECDRNQGVGQGNPAHTSCTESVPTPSESPTPSPSCTESCSSGGSGSGDTPSSDTPPPSSGSAPVLPPNDTPPSDTPTPVDSHAPAAQLDSVAALADTGVHVAPLLVMGVAFVVLGAAAVSLASVRRRASH
jgi:hypothetical protein